jgi:T5SS/PEP-CTERM-associated repeat protein/autotransporter-associated beta strand protein
MKKLRSIITVVFGFALVSMATDYTWTGSLTGGTWDTTANNWSAGCPGWSYESNSIPALTNIAVFNTSGLQATVSGTVYPNGLRVRGGSQLTIPSGASVTNTSWLSLNGNSKILLANGGALYSRAATEGFNDNSQSTTTFTFASADEPSPGGTVMLEATGEFRMNKVNVSDYKVILDNVTLLNNSGDGGNGFQVARGGARNYLIITNGATFKNVRSGKTLTIGIDGSGQNVISIHSNSVMNLNNGNMRMKGGSGQDQRVWINGGTLTNLGAFVYNNYNLPVGNVIITNQGKAFSTGATLVDGSNCIIRVTGMNSLWSLVGNNVTLGTTSRMDNRIEVDSSGVLTNIGTLTIDGTNLLSLASGGLLCVTNIDLKNGGTIDLKENGILVPSLNNGGLFNSATDRTFGFFTSSDGKGIFNANNRIFRPVRVNGTAFTCIVDRVSITNVTTVESVRGGSWSTTIFTNGATVFSTGGDGSKIGVDGDYATLAVYDDCVLRLGNRYLTLHGGTGGTVGRHTLLISGGIITNVLDFSITAEPNKRGVQAGTVRIERGGKLCSTANSTINCSNGVVKVTGPGSTWDMANTTLTIGGAGLGGNELALADGGMLSNAKIVLSPTQLVNRVTFDGGILKAGSAGTLISGSGECLIKTNGATIDSAGFTVANTLAMTEDSVSTGGGLTKLGAGTLTLATGTLYTGDTAISNGTLSVSERFLSDAADVYVSSNAVFNLSFSGTDTVRSLYIGGVLQERGRSYGSGHASGCFTGAGFIKPLVGTPPSGTIVIFM